MRPLRPTAIFVAMAFSISMARAAINDQCHEHCDCEDLSVTCKIGKLPIGTKEEGFGTYFDPDVTKMHIDNSESETSLNDKTRLEPLSSDMLTYEDLTNLTLKGCFIETIMDDAFQYIVALKHLNLEGNMITTLSAKTFFGLRQLQTLSLNYNKLATIPGGAFEPLISVVKLCLHGNLIDTIQPGAFPKNPLIESLDIGGNENMRTIPASVDALKNLDYLIARNCKISELRENWKDKFPGIVKIDLTNNLIPELKPEHFSDLPELKQVSLRRSFRWYNEEVALALRCMRIWSCFNEHGYPKNTRLALISHSSDWLTPITVFCVIGAPSLISAPLF